MPPTFRDFVDKLRLTADIVEVVGRHVDLKKVGSRWKGLCPFHNEKTPSFIVSPERQSYYCFGCQEHGDAIGFVAKIEKLDWREAALELGKRYGLEAPVRASAAEDDKQRKFFEALLAANQMAQEFFAQSLLSPKGAAARDYLAKREIDEETIKRFGIGLSLDGWDNLLRHGRNKGFSEEIMLGCGLLIRNEEKERTYDRFRNRIMFPICDSLGRPIAFGGRIYEPGFPETEAKYINSPETPLYKKGQNLYAFHLARDPIHDRKLAVVLEGYTDVIALHRHDFTHAVASLGTALTTEQARLLRRLCKEVVFLYDDDEPGRHAMIRGTEILLGQGFTVRCVGLKEGEDPDSFLRLQGPDAFAERLKAAWPFFDHFLTQALSKFDKSEVNGRTSIVEMLGGLIKATPNVIEAEEYVQRLSETISLSPDVVRAYLKIGDSHPKKRFPQTKPILDVPESIQKALPVHPAEKALLRILIDHPELAARFERFKLEWIENPMIRLLAERVIYTYASGTGGWQGFLEEASEEEQRVLREIMLSEEPVPNAALMLQQACQRLEIRSRGKQARALARGLDSAGLVPLDEVNAQLREIQHHLHQSLKAREEIRRQQEESKADPQS